MAESADSADETEVDAGIASQDFDDASQNPVVNGVDPMSLDGVIQLDDGNWYYFNHGKWQYVNGLYPNSAGWWYVEDGQVDFSHEGLETYGGSDWYVKNGQIQFDYNGPLAMASTDDWSEETSQTLYYISNGRVDTGFTGLAQATLNKARADSAVKEAQEELQKSQEELYQRSRKGLLALLICRQKSANWPAPWEMQKHSRKKPIDSMRRHSSKSPMKKMPLQTWRNSTD